MSYNSETCFAAKECLQKRKHTHSPYDLAIALCRVRDLVRIKLIERYFLCGCGGILKIKIQDYSFTITCDFDIFLYGIVQGVFFNNKTTHIVKFRPPIIGYDGRELSNGVMIGNLS